MCFYNCYNEFVIGKWMFCLSMRILIYFYDVGVGVLILRIEKKVMMKGFFFLVFSVYLI